jgi:hypothetical protein
MKTKTILSFSLFLIVGVNAFWESEYYKLHKNGCISEVQGNYCKALEYYKKLANKNETFLGRGFYKYGVE